VRDSYNIIKFAAKFYYKV